MSEKNILEEEMQVSKKNMSAEKLWLNGYYFALLLLFVVGSLLIWIGIVQYPSGTPLRDILVGIGISLAPASIVAALFRVFLFKEVQYQLTSPVINEVKEELGREIKQQVTDMLRNYQEEIATLQALRDAGMIRPYRRREMALKKFSTAIDAEEVEIMVVGSSLLGILKNDANKDIALKLKFKVTSTSARVKFLLTHPMVADFRVTQEARKFTDIGNEIIESLELLKNWGVSPNNVRLYKGTPTCFGIKTKKHMLLNPYPYGAVAYNSPCLIIETSEDHPSYFYDEFDKSHFRAWETDVATRISNFEETINELKEKLPIYAGMVQKMLCG